MRILKLNFLQENKKWVPENVCDLGSFLDRIPKTELQTLFTSEFSHEKRGMKKTSDAEEARSFSKPAVSTDCQLDGQH